ncbi:MAG TPA: peptidoglycan editing factor PgeF [Candidatus Avacidaminococcus intestinavium]|uniref:Purine nucleoside phosphorylase n=1 Tax=Candidatus Avacidaminococcus intestinavium TaxID=2840684 RepID=A0A9D1MMX5_9FIRM|nr:peptidoglycan editing factor PgeF [Candidatus Avacidaminococcus intestinavium]
MSGFNITGNGKNWYGYFPELRAAGFVNAFTCRMNGQSLLMPNELNLALHVGDDQQAVIRNRELIAQAIGFSLSRVVTCQQVHGADIAVVTESEMGRGSKALEDCIANVDALITAASNVPLMLFFADCVPIILADSKRGISAAVHAGWKGSMAEITLRTVHKMREEFGSRPEDIVAAIGPAIGACCYEVDETVYNKGEKYKKHFRSSRSGHWHLDLAQVNKQQLLLGGVPENNILLASVCTAENKALFFSHRAELGKTGRFAAIIFRK